MIKGKPREIVGVMRQARLLLLLLLRLRLRWVEMKLGVVIEESQVFETPES